MGRLVEFGLPDGDRVLVEVAGPQVGRIKPAVRGMIRQLHALSEEPDEVRIEFGLDPHAEAGAFVAQASADANFSVALTWRHKDDPQLERFDG